MTALPDLNAAFEAAGLLDVAYTLTDSPVGRLLLASTATGVVRLAYLDAGQSEDSVLSELAAKLSPRVLAAPRRLDPVLRELDDFFQGRLTRFTVPLDWTLTGAGFRQRVLRATNLVPYGQTTTYRELATQAGSVNAYRAAGNAVGSNPLPIIVPCHRVLHSSGGLGGYTGGLDRKRTLLTVEGHQLR